MVSTMWPILIIVGIALMALTAVLVVRIKRKIHGRSLLARTGEVSSEKELYEVCDEYRRRFGIQCWIISKEQRGDFGKAVYPLHHPWAKGDAAFSATVRDAAQPLLRDPLNTMEAARKVVEHGDLRELRAPPWVYALSTIAATLVKEIKLVEALKSEDVGCDSPLPPTKVLTHVIDVSEGTSVKTISDEDISCAWDIYADYFYVYDKFSFGSNWTSGFFNHSDWTAYLVLDSITHEWIRQIMFWVPLLSGVEKDDPIRFKEWMEKFASDTPPTSRELEKVAATIGPRMTARFSFNGQKKKRSYARVDEIYVDLLDTDNKELIDSYGGSMFRRASDYLLKPEEAKRLFVLARCDLLIQHPFDSEDLRRLLAAESNVEFDAVQVRFLYEIVSASVMKMINARMKKDSGGK